MTSTQQRRWRGLGTILAVVALTVGFGIGGREAGAQEGEGAERHPAHIHAGTCEQLGDVVVPLTDVGYGMLEGDAATAGESIGAESAVPVETGVTTVDMPLATIAAGGHAINVHLSAEEIGTYIACGDIGGQLLDEALVIGLRELNDSGHAGVAVLGDQGDTTGVLVFLLAPEGAAAEAAGEPATAEAATPAATPAATAVMVEIKDFAYNPDPVEIPVGSTITWTNQDAAPHTATARDRDVLQSGTLDQGESFSQTFAEAGTFDYFCEFHANMQGTVVVQ